MDKSQGQNCCSINKPVLKIFVMLNKYKPLIIIFIFCIIMSLAQIEYYNYQRFMDLFMGYFLIFLSLFKFFDIKSFAKNFISYDIISQKANIYAYIYPFIEFSLAILCLTNMLPILTNFVISIIMLIGGYSIFNAIKSGQKIKCACLGGALNVPLGVISIVENVVMGLMAMYNLFILLN